MNESIQEFLLAAIGIYAAIAVYIFTVVGSFIILRYISVSNYFCELGAEPSVHVFLKWYIPGVLLRLGGVAALSMIIIPIISDPITPTWLQICFTFAGIIYCISIFYIHVIQPLCEFKSTHPSFSKFSKKIGLEWIVQAWFLSATVLVTILLLSLIIQSL